MLAEHALTLPLDGTFLSLYSTRLCKTRGIFAGAFRPSPRNRRQRNTTTVLSSPARRARPANKGRSQASKLRSRGDLFRRCDASGQRQLRTKTPKRLGAHVWNWHLEPSGLNRPEIQRGTAPFVHPPIVSSELSRTSLVAHGATCSPELGAD
jgi:hypothetical protein